MLPLILSLLSPLLLLLLLPRPVTPLAYTVTGTKNGLPIDASAIELVAFPSERSGGLAALDLLTLTRRTQAPAAAPSPGAAVLDNNAWCGPVLTTPATNAVTAVHAYFQVPTPTLRPGVAAPQYVGEWVGIDGMSYSAALLQAGAAQAINSNGSIANWVWWEWYPEGSVALSTFPVASGDWLEVTITTTSPNAGTVTISNQNQAVAYTITLTQGPTLARVNADWIVEDPASGGGGHTPFPHFDAVWFEDAYAATANGSRYGMDRGQMYGISGRCAPHAYDSANFWASSVGGEG